MTSVILCLALVLLFVMAQEDSHVQQVDVPGFLAGKTHGQEALRLGWCG